MSDFFFFNCSTHSHEDDAADVSDSKVQIADYARHSVVLNIIIVVCQFFAYPLIYRKVVALLSDVALNLMTN